MSRRVIVGIVVSAVLLIGVGLSEAQYRNYAFIEEGVYQHTTVEGVVGHRYVGEVGFEKRIAELKELETSIGRLAEIDETLIEQLKMISKEIAELDAVVARASASRRSDGFLKSGGCAASEPLASFVFNPPWGSAATGTITSLDFTGAGSCRAYGSVFAYVWTPNATDSDSANTGGYVATVGIQAGAAVSAMSNTCKYASAVLVFNDSTPYFYDNEDQPTGCYSCPGCS
jgi:hypothetical protein